MAGLLLAPTVFAAAPTAAAARPASRPSGNRSAQATSSPAPRSSHVRSAHAAPSGAATTSPAAAPPAAAASPSEAVPPSESVPPSDAVPTSTPAACPQGRASIDRSPLQSTWPQRRLRFQRVWPITMGRHVVVAVIDSGLDAGNPQLRDAHIRRGINVTVDPPSHEVSDCVGHGSEVAAIIAAQQTPGSAFLGIAPQATLLPIKQSRDAHDELGAVFLARALRAAADAGAQVANVSVTAPTATQGLVAAVRYARRKGMVIVASVGNDQGTGNQPLYPAALSTRFDNVIAVSASDAHDGVPPFPESGPYVDIAAPGLDFQVPAPGSGFVDVNGTSFAAPYVTGTVALMLSADPQLTPAQVRDRLEATADPPPVSVPSPLYGYGVVDPLLAVTAVRAGTGRPPSPSAGAPLPAPAAAPPVDHSTRHVALAVGAGLLGLAVVVLIGAAVLRGSTATRR